MTEREALRLALEALECTGLKWPQVEEAINAIKAALAAKPEPVAWRYDQAKYRINDLRGRQWAFNVFSQARPYMDEMVQNVTPLYTNPPQRTWTGLTEDDKVLIKHDANFNQFISASEYADRVQQLTEARLKDKNT